MKTVELYARVRRAVLVEGMSRRAAAREFGLARKTVSKMLAYSAPPGYQRHKPVRRPKLGPWQGVIDAILEDDKQRPRKQRHTAKRILERLRAEHSYTGGYTIVKDYVRDKKLGGREMFIPLTHAPGEAQADFGEAQVVIAGVEHKAHFMAFDLPHSDDCFVQAFPAETTEAFLEAHAGAFEYFGGVPTRILYDNTTLAVARILGDGERAKTRAFSELQSHYLRGLGKKDFERLTTLYVRHELVSREQLRKYINESTGKVGPTTYFVNMTLEQADIIIVAPAGLKTDWHIATTGGRLFGANAEVKWQFNSNDCFDLWTLQETGFADPDEDAALNQPEVGIGQAVPTRPGSTVMVFENPVKKDTKVYCIGTWDGKFFTDGRLARPIEYPLKGKDGGDRVFFEAVEYSPSEPQSPTVRRNTKETLQAIMEKLNQPRVLAYRLVGMGCDHGEGPPQFASEGE